MAEDKKSFVMYADLIHVIRKLVEQDRLNKTNYAGELFLHIWEYVNDNEPIPINFIIDMAFEPIKQQLKRDLSRYTDKKIKFSEAGKKSAEAKRLAKIDENILTKSTNVENVEGSITFSTVNVNDNVSVNVNDNVTVTDILLKKETKEEFKKIVIPKNEIYGREILESQSWIETVSMQNKITPEEVPKWIEDFNKKLISELDNKISKKEYASHFSRWLPGEILKSKKIIGNGKQNAGTGIPTSSFAKNR
ncbi:MAG: DUF6291 domain-containing protein [Bacteroidota bacterium]